MDLTDFSPPNADHGYATLEWEGVNEHFGNSEELKNLIETAHLKEILIMLDVVTNHSIYTANFHNNKYVTSKDASKYLRQTTYFINLTIHL